MTVPTTFRYAARSDVGLVRSDNQDSGYAGPHLLVVADGMGGHAGGDLASSTAIAAMAAIDGDSLTSGEASDALDRVIHEANARIGRIVDGEPELLGMGTTVTALLRARNKLVLAHIGDSRAYLLREGRFEQITKDHSLVQTLVDEGRITEDEASTHPQRSVVTRVLTGQPGDEPDLGIREARRGDRYMLCSDGLCGFVAHDTIEEVLSGTDDPGQAADRLVALALRAGAPDNVTVVVADVVDPAQGPSTQPQVVGAASLRRSGTQQSAAPTPAQKAAALRPVPLEEDADVEEHSSRGRLLTMLAAVLTVLLLAAGATWAAYSWTQDQYYLGEQDGVVTVYRGVSMDLGPVSLSDPIEQTDVRLADLPEFDREGIRDTVKVVDLEQARTRVEQLERTAAECRQARADGDECGVEGPTSTSTSTTSGTKTSGTKTSGAEPSGGSR